LNEHKQGKRRLTDLAALRHVAEKIVQHYQVEGLLNLSYTESVEEYLVRRYKERPAETRVKHHLSLPPG